MGEPPPTEMILSMEESAATSLVASSSWAMGAEFGINSKDQRLLLIRGGLYLTMLFDIAEGSAVGGAEEFLDLLDEGRFVRERGTGDDEGFGILGGQTGE